MRRDLHEFCGGMAIRPRQTTGSAIWGLASCCCVSSRCQKMRWGVPTHTDQGNRMIDDSIRRAVEDEIVDYADSSLSRLVEKHGAYAIKFVQSRWADLYVSPHPLKISETPALTWGRATYVTPLAFPLSSALYGRIGLVTDFTPEGWRVFDATRLSARDAYLRWARSQPIYQDLLLTVHSTHANHVLRNTFRERFNIDCVLFHPDQEAEIHTDADQHVWMAVTDWAPNGTIESGMSQRLGNARFTVLIDENFLLEDRGLPIRVANRQIERATAGIRPQQCVGVSGARLDPQLPQEIAQLYRANGYLHVFIEP